MRRHRSIFDNFPENVDLNQGPNFNNRGMNESDECNGRLSPTERRLLSNELSGEINFSRVNAGDHHNSRSFRSWDIGESSSRANVQDQVPNDDLKPERNRLNSQLCDSFGGSQSAVGPLNLQNSGSNRMPMDVDLNVDYNANSINDLNVDYNANHVPGMPRNALPQEIESEENFRIRLRNNEQHRYFVPSNETRNPVQDPNNWSLATGRSRSNGGNGNPSLNPSNALWTPRFNPTTQSQQRLSDIPPWTLFPASDADSVGRRGHFRPFPSGSSSTSEENVFSFGGNSHGRRHQPFQRSVSLMEVPGDEWQAFAADIEGRHRLVSEMRQILSALERGESLRAEDYMFLDPFINEGADLHDRHRDMRLDVDNMSYEELLALEERIGDVKTGLSEEVILKSMKQRKHISFMAISTQNLEPCCICREEYDNGDDIGTLDCGHDFHTCCIKQWLAQKNLCPICKMTGLST